MDVGTLAPTYPANTGTAFVVQADHTSRVRCNHRRPQWAGLGQYSRAVFGLDSYMFCWLGKGDYDPMNRKKRERIIIVFDIHAT